MKFKKPLGFWGASPPRPPDQGLCPLDPCWGSAPDPVLWGLPPPDPRKPYLNLFRPLALVVKIS